MNKKTQKIVVGLLSVYLIVSGMLTVFAADTNSTKVIDIKDENVKQALLHIYDSNEDGLLTEMELNQEVSQASITIGHVNTADVAHDEDGIIDLSQLDLIGHPECITSFEIFTTAEKIIGCDVLGQFSSVEHVEIDQPNWSTAKQIELDDIDFLNHWIFAYCTIRNVNLANFNGELNVKTNNYKLYNSSGNVFELQNCNLKKIKLLNYENVPLSYVDYLSFSNNHLTDNNIDINCVQSCNKVYLDNNELTSLSWLNTNILKQGLSVSNNKITDISSLEGILNRNENYISFSLDISGNPIEDLVSLGEWDDSTSDIHLWLNASNTLIDDFDMNKISDMNKIRNFKFMELNLYNTNITKIQDWMFNAYYIALGGPSIVGEIIIPEQYAYRIKQLEIRDSETTSIQGLENCNTLDRADLSNNALTEIPCVTGCEALTQLYLQNNEIKKADMKQLPGNFLNLDLSYNQIKENINTIIDFFEDSQYTHLKMDLSDNLFFGTLRLSDLRNYQCLDVSNNTIDTFIIDTTNSALEILDLHNNGLYIKQENNGIIYGYGISYLKDAIEQPIAANGILYSSPGYELLNVAGNHIDIETAKAVFSKSCFDVEGWEEAQGFIYSNNEKPVRPSETPVLPSDKPVNEKTLDVDGVKGITLSDAQMILKFALKIEKSDFDYTLGDAQKALKIALKIEIAE